jgi:hypothetical protein
VARATETPDLDPAMVDPVIQGTVPPPVLGRQGQVHQRFDRPVGAQHRLGQLEQLISAGRQALVELLPKPRQSGQAVAVVDANFAAIGSHSRRTCQSGHRGHRLASVALHEPEDETVTVPRHGDTPCPDGHSPLKDESPLSSPTATFAKIRT